MARMTQKSCINEYPGIHGQKIKRTSVSHNRLKFDIRIEVGDEKEIFTEYLIYDTLNFIGALGGTLGLFIGFSFFGYITPCVETFIDKVAKLLPS